MNEVPVWERRYRAPSMTLPHWSRSSPDRTVFETNESGTWQVHMWDAAAGDRRQVSSHPVGVTEGYATVDGAEVVFWQEDTGDETGRWLTQAWEGGGDEPFILGVPTGWNEGLAQAPGITVVAISDRDGFGAYTSVEGETATKVAASKEWFSLAGRERGAVDIAALSPDGRLLCLEHAEGAHLVHPALRVIDPRSGEVVAELRDEGRALYATAWSPVAGDGRLAVLHERGDRQRPAIWEPRTDGWVDVEVDLPGDVRIQDWWPDAASVLLHHAFEGRHELYRHDLRTGAAEPLATPPGSIEDARVRPDGRVWFLHSDGERRGRVLDDAGAEPIAVLGEAAPPGRPFMSWRFTNRVGGTVHGFTIQPEGEGPWPVILFTHGGPHWLYEDRFMPEAQAYADLGFLVAMVNYRGSTGYGRAWRDALTGDVGFADVDDVTDGLDDLIDRGLADPDRSVIGGWSWGGYITLMELGREPDRWRAGVAGVPVGDYVGAFRDEAPTLQALDRALMGGSPEDAPEAYRKANPIEYAGNVKAPVLFVIGDNDSRCPLAQALAYVERLAELSAPHQVYRFSTGHGSLVTDEDVRQLRVILDFLKAQVPGLADI